MDYIYFHFFNYRKAKIYFLRTVNNCVIFNIYNQFKLIKQQRITFRSYFNRPEFVVEKFLFSIQVYFQATGELDQYKKQIITQNLPNEYILDLMFNKNNYIEIRGISSRFTEEFLIFLIKNNMIILIDKILLSIKGNIIIEDLEQKTYLHMLDNYDHDYVKKLLCDYFLSKGWYWFVIHRKSELRNFFLNRCLLLRRFQCSVPLFEKKTR